MRSQAHQVGRRRLLFLFLDATLNGQRSALEVKLPADDVLERLGGARHRLKNTPGTTRQEQRLYNAERLA